MKAFFIIVSIILVIAYLFFIYKIRYRNENTLENNIKVDSTGALLMLLWMIAAIIKGATWLAISSGIIMVIDICMVIYYIVAKKTLR
jgi:low temperature requirement protein LtrA